jgi:hypothetical protein
LNTAYQCVLTVNEAERHGGFLYIARTIPKYGTLLRPNRGRNWDFEGMIIAGE